MKKSVHLCIYGHVQGVFFRQSTRVKARSLGLCGWVKNCNNGSVEAEAEGEESRLNEFIEWCHKGPERANVIRVEISNAELKNFISFEIKRN